MITVRYRVVKNNIPQVMAAITAGRDELAGGVARGMEGYAQGNAPVLFGYLRNSIHTTGGGGDYTVVAQSTLGGAPRDYAHFVEYGTSKMAAQPYMQPAFANGVATDLPREAATFGRKIEAAAG